MTALTRAGTLSRVMTSWGGTSMVMVLRSILTILSTNGKSKKSPGPLGPPCTRPRRKITPRSYSLTILTALTRTATTNISTITTRMAASPIPTVCNRPKVACTRNPPLSGRTTEVSTATEQLDGHHLHHPSLAEPHHPHLASLSYRRLAILRVGLIGGERQHGPPPLAVNEHPSLGVHPHGAPEGADLAYHPFLAGKCRPPPERPQRAQEAQEHAPHEHRDDRQGSEKHARVGDAGPQQ